MAGVFLVADRDKKHSAKLADLLRRTGHEVFEITQGKQVIRVLLKNDVQAVFIDTDFPGLKCPESIQILKAVNPELPIIVMSGKTNKSLEQAVRVAGVYYYALKPIEETELFSLINNLGRNIRKAKRTRREKTVRDRAERKSDKGRAGSPSRRGKKGVLSHEVRG